MNDERLSDYLSYMREAAISAMQFADGMTKADFMSDKRTQQAVAMSFIIIGETSAKMLERFPQFTQSTMEIPWKNMRGMRNRMAHGYFSIDFGVVWDAIHEDLPNLLRYVDTQAAIEQEESDSGPTS